MRGTRAVSLIRHYGSWGKPLVVMTDRHDGVMDRVEDLSLPTVDWPPDRRDLVETIRVMARGEAATAGGSGSAPA
jgi:hypothetical protein